MRTAPPVRVLCTGGPLWRGLQSLLPSLATAVSVAWLAGHGGWTARTTAITALACAVVVAAVAWRVAVPRARLLGWNAQGWSVDEAAGALQVMMDLNRWLLLRFAPGPRGRVCWLAVSASEAGAAWHGLRAALYAAPPSQDAAPAQAGPHV